MKSRALDQIQNIVIETLRDGYAALAAVSDPIVAIRKDDCERDAAYIRRRVESEGLTFLTVILPSLGVFIDEYVRGGEVERVIGFKPYDGLFPTFLRPFWYLLRGIREGQSDLSWLKVYRILRTLCYGCKKLEVPYSQEQVRTKMENFLEIEEFLGNSHLYPTPALHRAQMVMEEALEEYVPECQHPRHGPGAVAGGERHNRKWVWTHLYQSLDQEWPYREFIFPIRSQVRMAVKPHMLGGTGYSWSEAVSFQYRDFVLGGGKLTIEPEPTARLLFVPKDSRGPRIISCEPKELMYVQQGVANHLVRYIETNRYTRGHVNFDDQEVNGHLALEASLSHEWATIDLSDASDRVSNELVRFLVPSEVWRKWNSLRSTHTLLPDGSKLPLKKFAPMGSAMCFPVESLVFWAICVGAVWEQSGDLSLARSSVYVFGDDIIVADAYYEAVTEALSDADLWVNYEKSFSGAADFRESCGIDAFRGVDVTPFRLRKLPPSRPSDGNGIVAYVKYAENSQYVCPRRSSLMLRMVEELVGMPIPRVPFPQPFLSFVTKDKVWSIDDYHRPRWNPDLCYYTCRLIATSPKRLHSAIDGWQRMQKALTQRILHDPTEVVDRASTQMRRRWLPITYLELKPA